VLFRSPICGCTPATAEDHTAQSTVDVAFGGAVGLAYAPKCITVKTGTVVTFSGDFAFHPLRPSPSLSDPANPIVDVGPTDAGATASFTFSGAGSFGYHCQAHGTDDTGMCGAVYVVP
jgi:plastocyanin